MAEALKAYRRSEIETASPEKLTLALYDGALGAMRRGAADIAAQRWTEAHRQLTKAQDILGELAGALRLDAGGDMAKGLFALYDFLISHLVRANFKKDARLVEEAAALLAPVREAWDQSVVRRLPPPAAPRVQEGAPPAGR